MLVLKHFRYAAIFFSRQPSERILRIVFALEFDVASPNPLDLLELRWRFAINATLRILSP